MDKFVYSIVFDKLCLSLRETLLRQLTNEGATTGFMISIPKSSSLHMDSVFYG